MANPGMSVENSLLLLRQLLAAGIAIQAVPIGGDLIVTLDGEEVTVRLTGGAPTPFNATGSGAIAVSSSIGTAFRIVAVLCHFSAAPVTSEDLTVTLNAVAGAAYDIVLYREDPGANSLADVVYIPDGGDLVFRVGDELDVAFANTDGRTYGVQILLEPR